MPHRPGGKTASCGRLIMRVAIRAEARVRAARGGEAPDRYMRFTFANHGCLS